MEAVADATPRIVNVAWAGPVMPPDFQGARLDVQEIGRLSRFVGDLKEEIGSIMTDLR